MDVKRISRARITNQITNALVHNNPGEPVLKAGGNMFAKRLVTPATSIAATLHARLHHLLHHLALISAPIASQI